jgi:hypothetical protein
MVAKSKKNGIIIMQLIYVTDEYPQFLYGYPGRHENSGQPLFFGDLYRKFPHDEIKIFHIICKNKH